MVLDLADGARDVRFAVGADGPSLLAVSADGRVTARVSPAGKAGATLALFETGTGRELGGPVEIGFPPSSVALSADGSLVAVAGGSAEAAWYRTDDGGQVGSLPGASRRRGPGGLPIRRPLRHRGRDLRGERHAVRRFGGRSPPCRGSGDVGGRGTDRGTGSLLGEPAGRDPGRSARGGRTRRHRRGRPRIDDAAVVDRHPGSAHPENCPWLAVAPSTARLYCGDYYGVIHERDLASGLPTGVLLDPQNGSVGRLAVSSDGRELVAFGAEAPVVSRWRLDGSGPITRLVAPGHVVYDGYDASGASLLVAARPAGSNVDGDFHDFAVWDPVTDRPTAAWSDVEGLGWAGRDTVTGFAPAAGRLESTTA